MLTVAADLEITLTLPDHWYQIPLDPGDRDRRIAELVTERVSPDPQLAAVRRALTAKLQRVAAAARAEHALICASMTLSVPDDVVGAHLVVGLVDTASPADGPGPLEVADLPRVGQVERTTLRRRLDVPGSTGVLTTMQVRYDIPAAIAPGRCVRLTFSSPSVLYAVPLRAMFDLIASSVRTVQA